MGIRKGQMPLARGLGRLPKSLFIINHRTVHMGPCNPVEATLAVALAARLPMPRGIFCFMETLSKPPE